MKLEVAVWMRPATVRKLLRCLSR